MLAFMQKNTDRHLDKEMKDTNEMTELKEIKTRHFAFLKITAITH
jgi:hypothetical protein